jgi:hypothetical protein
MSHECIGATAHLDHGPAFQCSSHHGWKDGDKPRLRRRQEVELQTLPSVREPDDEWADEEIGKAIRLLKGGWDVVLISEVMGIPAHDLGQKFHAIAEAIQGRRRMRPGVKGAPAHRPRSVTPEQEAAILGLRAKGATLKLIAIELGLSEGRVRYVCDDHRSEP